MRIFKITGSLILISLVLTGSLYLLDMISKDEFSHVTPRMIGLLLVLGVGSQFVGLIISAPKSRFNPEDYKTGPRL